PTRIAQAPTTEGVIASLREENLTGQTVGVTLYGEPNLPLEQFLHSAEAQVRAVMPYVYAPASDDDRVVDLITRLNRGEVDVLIFTSPPQLERLHEVAEQRGVVDLLRTGLQRTRVAAVGPVVAEHLREHGDPVHICPEQGFVM